MEHSNDAHYLVILKIQLVLRHSVRQMDRPWICPLSAYTVWYYIDDVIGYTVYPLDVKDFVVFECQWIENTNTWST